MRGKGERPIPKELQKKGGCLFLGLGAKTTYTHEKAAIKQQMLLVDRAIAQIELFIADQAKH